MLYSWGLMHGLIFHSLLLKSCLLAILLNVGEVMKSRYNNVKCIFWVIKLGPGSPWTLSRTLGSCSLPVELCYITASVLLGCSDTCCCETFVIPLFASWASLLLLLLLTNLKLDITCWSLGPQTSSKLTSSSQIMNDSAAGQSRQRSWQVSISHWPLGANEGRDKETDVASQRR